jgi:NAD(P)H-nitrite reductase large subunit
VIVCHCERVAAAAVEAAIASGAGTVDDVSSRCRAGRQCGSCWSTIEQLLAAAAPDTRVTVSAVA